MPQISSWGLEMTNYPEKLWPLPFRWETTLCAADREASAHMGNNHKVSNGLNVAYSARLLVTPPPAASGECAQIKLRPLRETAFLWSSTKWYGVQNCFSETASLRNSKKIYSDTGRCYTLCDIVMTWCTLHRASFFYFFLLKGKQWLGSTGDTFISPLESAPEHCMQTAGKRLWETSFTPFSSCTPSNQQPLGKQVKRE